MSSPSPRAGQPSPGRDDGLRGDISVTTAEGVRQLRCSTSDVVVIIDVVRAFTTAAILFHRGVRTISCVADAAAADALARSRTPRSLRVGEHPGLPSNAVDLPNSPQAALRVRGDGRHAILFTNNGTRGLLRAPEGCTLLVAAAVNLTATAHWITRNRPRADVRLVVTDPLSPEDVACAEQLRVVLRGQNLDADGLFAEILAASDAHARQWRAHVSSGEWADFLNDVELCAQVDRFPLPLLGERVCPGRTSLRPGRPAPQTFGVSSPGARSGRDPAS